MMGLSDVLSDAVCDLDEYLADTDSDPHWHAGDDTYERVRIVRDVMDELRAELDYGYGPLEKSVLVQTLVRHRANAAYQRRLGQDRATADGDAGE